MAEADRTLHTETDIAAYRGYIPDDWGEKTVGPLKEGTVLERLVLDLSLAWRSASYTAQMPATSIRAMHAVAVGLSNFATPNASIVRFADAVIGRLADRVPELAVDRTLGMRLVQELETIATDFRDRAAAVPYQVPVETMWAPFMQDVAFRISLWSSQRIAYVAFYNAYEAFLVDCLKVGGGLSSLRSSDKKPFNEALRTALGKDITCACWSHHEINIPRLVRHALSHNGGRETEDLKKQKHGIRLIGDELQIVPNDVHRMLSRLRMAVDDVISVACGNAKFLAPPAKMACMQEEG